MTTDQEDGGRQLQAEGNYPNTTRQTLSNETLNALKELRKAFLKLEEATERSDTDDFTEWDELSSEYPFEKSYDELTIEVSEWVKHHEATNGVSK